MSPFGTPAPASRGGHGALGDPPATPDTSSWATPTLASSLACLPPTSEALGVPLLSADLGSVVTEVVATPL